MMHKGTLLGLLAAVAILAGAWLIVADRAPDTEIEKYALFPDLANEINNVNKIDIRSADSTCSIQLADGKWRVGEFDDYPGDFGTVKKAVVQLSELQVLEPKTQDPALYERLGVRDLSDEGAKGTLITLRDAADGVVVSLIIGNRPSAGTGARTSQHYVRIPGQKQALLVSGAIDIQASPAHWVDTELVDIPANSVKHVALEHGDGDRIIINRKARTGTDWALSDIPEGKKLADTAGLSSLSSILSGLRFTGAKSAKNIAGLAPQDSLTLLTYDGLIASAASYAIDDETFLSLHFEFDAAQYVPEKSNAADAPDDTDKTSTDAGEDTPVETAKKDVKTYNDRVAGWIFVLPEYKLTALQKRFDDLVEPVEDAE